MCSQINLEKKHFTFCHALYYAPYPYSLTKLFRMLMPGNERFLSAPSLATRCDVKLSDPLAILTAGSMTLDLTVSKLGLGNVGGAGSIYLQSSHMALGTSKSSWTSSTSQNTVMTRRPLACKKNI